jgi:hypothetical protein
MRPAPAGTVGSKGIVQGPRSLTVHVADSLAVDLPGEWEDEIDLFLFASGDRLGRLERPYEYLHRRGDGPFRWVNLDKGFEGQRPLKAIAMTDD